MVPGASSYPAQEEGPMEVDEEVATLPLPPEGFSGVWPPSTNARPVSAPLRRPAGLVLGRAPITLSVWDIPVEMAGPPPGVTIKNMVVSAKEMLAPAKVTSEPLIMSVTLPDQMAAGMRVKTEESTKEVDLAVYTQAQQLVRRHRDPRGCHSISWPAIMVGTMA